MKNNTCMTIQASFTAYLDGAVSGHEMQEISRHIEGQEMMAACDVCAQEFSALRQTQDAIATLRPAKAPADLNLRLRLAISREKARRNFRLRDRISLMWDNAVRPLLVQVSIGAACSAVLVGSIMALLGFVATPQAVLAHDEPLGAITAPHYLYSTFSPGMVITGSDTPVMVEASVNSAGRVYDYTIVSGPQDDAVRTQVAGQLLGIVFQPASVFGLPIRGHVVLTFAGISVHG